MTPGSAEVLSGGNHVVGSIIMMLQLLLVTDAGPRPQDFPTTRSLWRVTVQPDGQNRSSRILPTLDRVRVCVVQKQNRVSEFVKRFELPRLLKLVSL